MLKTRVLTAVILIPLVLAALFGLDTLWWGVLTLIVVGIGASEWSRLAAFSTPGSVLFVSATIVIGLCLLFFPGSGFMTGSGWPESVVLCVCGAATLLWRLISPRWLYAASRVTCGAALCAITCPAM